MSKHHTTRGHRHTAKEIDAGVGGEQREHQLKELGRAGKQSKRRKAGGRRGAGRHVTAFRGFEVTLDRGDILILLAKRRDGATRGAVWLKPRVARELAGQLHLLAAELDGAAGD